MPKLEPKIIQKELEQGQLWPFYWLHGTETMKSRELMKRIKKAALGTTDETTEAAGFFHASFNEVTLEGAEITGPELVDQANSLSLGGGTRVILVKDAHLMKQPEAATELLRKRGKAGELSSVVICISKDLDQRKKFSKALVEHAAVVACEEIADADREAWIGYLAKRRGLALTPEMVALMRAMDPWSLDLIDRELEKLEVSGTNADVLIGGAGTEGAEERFIALFYARNSQAIEEVSAFADSPDRALPLLGLMAWNTRMLSQLLKDQKDRTREVKLSPFLIERFQRWLGHWTIHDVAELQHGLKEIDFSIKQTARVPIGLWTNLVLRFTN